MQTPKLLLFIFYATSLLSRHVDSYIVLFKTPEDKDQEQMIYANTYARMESYFTGDEEIVGRLSNGFIANMGEESRAKAAADTSIAIVEKDRDVSIAGSMFSLDTKTGVKEYDKYYKILEADQNRVEIQEKAPWGISRVSSGKRLKKSLEYRYPSSAGSGVDVYVIDTGIQTDHPEFRGHAKWGINLVEGSADADEHGHGTHCAGIVGGQNMGLAKKANLIAVKVLDKNGVGKISRVILGVDYVIRQHSKKADEIDEKYRNMFLERERNPKDEMEYEMTTSDPKYKNNFIKELTEYLQIDEVRPKTVVNMSVGGLRSRALEFAVDYATKLGIHFSVAAGNDHQDACLFSPGSSKNALTVGASTKEDTVAFFSNMGDCVDLYAPGMEIRSSWINNEIKIASGTSMAAPHAAGVMALYLSLAYYEPADLKNKLIKDSYDVIEDEEENEDMLKFWPVKYFFGEDKKCLNLLSSKKLNDTIHTVHH